MPPHHEYPTPKPPPPLWEGKGGTGAEPHLRHGRVDLQDLLVTFDLANADLAGELGGGGAVALQAEGTVQGLLVAAPHLGEGELLGAEEDAGLLSRQLKTSDGAIKNIPDGHENKHREPRR